MKEPEIKTLSNKIGNLANLSTTSKANLVEALNDTVNILTEFISDIDGGDFTSIPSTDFIDGGTF